MFSTNLNKSYCMLHLQCNAWFGISDRFFCGVYCIKLTTLSWSCCACRDFKSLIKNNYDNCYLVGQEILNFCNCYNMKIWGCEKQFHSIFHRRKQTWNFWSVIKKNPRSMGSVHPVMGLWGSQSHSIFWQKKKKKKTWNFGSLTNSGAQTVHIRTWGCECHCLKKIEEKFKCN